MKRDRSQPRVARGHAKRIEKRLAVAASKSRAVAVNAEAFAAWMRAL